MNTSEITYSQDAFYLAREKDSLTWIVVRCIKDSLFVKTNNTNRYSYTAFDEIHPKPLFEAIDSLKDKAKNLQKIASGYHTSLMEIEQRKKALTDNSDVISELLKTIGTVVDQLNGDLTLTGHDLESTNTKIVRLYTILQDRKAI